MIKRIATAIIGIPLLIFMLIMGDIYLFLPILIISLIGLYEFYSALEGKGYKPFFYLGYMFTFTILSGFYYKSTLPYFLINIVLLIMLLSFIQLKKHKYSIVDCALTTYGILYIPLLLGHIILTAALPKRECVWLIFIVAWSTDTFAYFGGLIFGSKKLCPKISPKKTIAGAIWGVIGSVVACGLFASIYFNDYIILFMSFGLLSSILSQLGDLTASQIKRHVEIKDFGHIFPGHGGVLDRFDSILFTAPAVYYFFILLINL